MVDFSLTEDDLKLLIAANAHLGSKNTNVRLKFGNYIVLMMNTSIGNKIEIQKGAELYLIQLVRYRKADSQTFSAVLKHKNLLGL